MAEGGFGRRIGGPLLTILGAVLLLGGLAGLYVIFNWFAVVVVLLGVTSAVSGVTLMRLGHTKTFRLAEHTRPQTVARPMKGAIFSMEGVQDLLEVFEDTVTITPKGVLGFLNKGLQGTKTIPFASISATQFREAGPVVSGYIQFSIPGGNESRGGVLSATHDENTFMFAQRKNNEVATRIKNHIESRVRDLRTKHTPQAPKSLADELQKLATMRDQGLLSEAEFTSSKGKLLG